MILLLSPTRELATQTSKEVEVLTQGTCLRTASVALPPSLHPSLPLPLSLSLSFSLSLSLSLPLPLSLSLPLPLRCLRQADV